MKRYFIGMMLVILVSPAFGEMQTFTLSNVIELALLNNLEISRSEQEIKVAEAQYGQAMADFAMPSVTASASFTLLDPTTVQDGMMASFEKTSTPNPAFLNLPLAPMTLTNAYADNYQTGISINKPVFAGFKLWNVLGVRQASLDIARAKLADRKKEAITVVIAGFYQLFLIKENIRMLEDLNNSLKDSVDYAKHNYQAGNATEYDFIRASVQYQNNQPDILQMSNSYTIAKISLCQQIGIAHPDSVVFIGSLYDATNIVLKETNREKIIGLAISNDIGLREADMNLKIARFKKEIAEAGKAPVLNAFFNYNFGYGKTNSSLPIDRTWNSSWNTGLQLSLSVDSWIPGVSKNWNVCAEAESNIKVLEILKRQLTDGVVLKVQTLLLHIDQSSENIKSQRENLHQAQYIYHLAENKYRSGASGMLEVNDAQAAMSKAEATYLGAVYAYFSDSLKLKKLIGE